MKNFFKHSFTLLLLTLIVSCNSTSVPTKALELIESGKLKTGVEAIADYTAAIKIYAEYDSAYLYRGLAYSKLQEIKLAMEDLNRAISISPDMAYAYFVRAGVKGDLNDTIGVFQDYDQAIKLAPTDAYILFCRARSRIIYYSDNYGAFADAYKAHKLDPKLIEPYLILATTPPSEDEIEKTIEFSEIAISVIRDKYKPTQHPENPNVLIYPSDYLRANLMRDEDCHYFPDYILFDLYGNSFLYNERYGEALEIFKEASMIFKNSNELKEKIEETQRKLDKASKK